VLTAQGFPPVTERDWISFPHKRQVNGCHRYSSQMRQNMEISKRDVLVKKVETTDAKGLEGSR
jgi:hypothetical protein